MPQIALYTLLELVGELTDSTESGSASTRFRKYLQGNLQQVSDVRTYVKDALAQSGDQFNKALQDLINHIGQLLGFTVVYGRYRGVKGQIGFDGLWQSPTGWSIVVETKTTDVYTVKTATLLGYINGLVSEGQIKNPSNALGLYVYGRFDAQTNQLENAVIVEGRRERLRVVSVDALLNLLELTQEYQLTHETILGFLLPAPVKVDGLVNLILNIVAQEKREPTQVQPLAHLANSALDEQKNASEEEEIDDDEQTFTPLTAMSDDYKNRSVHGVIFQNTRYEVNTWREAMLALLNVLRDQQRTQFEEVALTLIGRKRPYVTTEPEQLRSPERIPQTSLYFETNLSANSTAKVCYTLLEKLGYAHNSLIFETKQKEARSRSKGL